MAFGFHDYVRSADEAIRFKEVDFTVAGGLSAKVHVHVTDARGVSDPVSDRPGVTVVILGTGTAPGARITSPQPAHFTVLLPSGDVLETKGDPIVTVNGVDVGHWPSSVVTYVLPNGVELTCHARGYNSDVSQIEIWTPDSPVVQEIRDVNLPKQKHSERVLTRFEEANREMRDRGTVLTWDGSTWRQANGESFPKVEAMIQVEPATPPPASPPADTGELVPDDDR